MLLDPLFHLAILQVIWVDVLLSGDNAVVVALACRDLPKRQRQIGIALGVAAALVLRVAMTGAVSYLFSVPFLQIIGGLVLFYIAIKLVKGDDGDAKSRTPRGLLHAIWVIAIADASMSLDNVVAIAAASRGYPFAFIFGIALSIPLMIVGASVITVLVRRFPALVWAGGGLLGWIAGGMMFDDPYALSLLPPGMENGVHYAASIGFMLAVLSYSWISTALTKRRKQRDGTPLFDAPLAGPSHLGDHVARQQPEAGDDARGATRVPKMRRADPAQGDDLQALPQRRGTGDRWPSD